MVNWQEIAEWVALLWGLLIMSVIIVFIIEGHIQNEKFKNLLQRKINRFLHCEVEYAVWRNRKKKAETP